MQMKARKSNLKHRYPKPHHSILNCRILYLIILHLSILCQSQQPLLYIEKEKNSLSCDINIKYKLAIFYLFLLFLTFLFFSYFIHSVSRIFFLQMSHIIHSQAGQLASQRHKSQNLQQSLQEELSVAQETISLQEMEIIGLKK